MYVYSIYTTPGFLDGRKSVFVMIVYILAEHVVTMYANYVNDYYIYVIIIM